MSTLIPIVLVAALLSGLLTRRVLGYASRRELLDVPNERSSHSVPKPRGGGLAIAAVFFVGTVSLALLGRLEGTGAFVLAAGGALVAAVGWIDDRTGVSARVRFAVHVAAVALVIAGTASLGALRMPGFPDLPWIQFTAAAFALVWLINLFNFMDGIDGLAGAEAAFVASGLVVCLVLDGQGGAGAATCAALLAGASLGFLTWNWPPAKIFMGDVGSGFLGFALGGVALLAHRETGLNLWVPTILLAVFVTDATLTLVRRIGRGERWYSAHRSHAYQWLSRQYGAHRPVTMAVVAVNLGWLLPLAILATRLPAYAGQLAALAYMPLLPLALWSGSGRPELSPR